MLFLNVPPQGDVILSVLGYVGIPSLLIALLWVYYNVKRTLERVDKLELDVKEVQSVQASQGTNFALTVQKLTTSIEHLETTIQDLPEKVVNKLIKDGILSIKN